MDSNDQRDYAEEAANRAEMEREQAEEAPRVVTVYTVTDHKTNSGSWCRWSNVRVSESYWMNEPEQEERCPADCLASSISVTTEEA